MFAGRLYEKLLTPCSSAVAFRNVLLVENPPVVCFVPKLGSFSVNFASPLTFLSRGGRGGGEAGWVEKFVAWFFSERGTMLASLWVG